MTGHSATLRSIFIEHSGKASDKWAMYLDEYNRLFDSYRDLPVRLLEIGIQNGGSLEIWKKYFSNAEMIVGCDNNPVCAQLIYADPQIVVVMADANTDEAEQRIRAVSAAFDLIIDDGSHHSGDIVRSFARYFAHLADGGMYIAEDLHCSYWQGFEGGLFHPDSSVTFFKRLADVINHEHWGVDVTRCELLKGFSSKYTATLDEVALASIHSIEFINSMCVIRKAQPDANVLGHRLIVGAEALVCSDILPFHGSSSLLTSQTDNPWSSEDCPLDAALLAQTQEIARLTASVSARDTEIANLNQTATASALDNLAQLAQVRQQLETKLLQLTEQNQLRSGLEQSVKTYLQTNQDSANVLALLISDSPNPAR